MSHASSAVLVLGMHRSGTSCVARMLSTAGIAAAGAAVRNWDNARGHFEALALVRLNEAVLAASGGHWLGAPREVRWTAAQAEERERLLEARVDGRAPLLKDPRTLLCLAFWRASSASFRALGVVRRPLAVARSLAAWRGLPLAQGVALWSAHNRVLLADQEAHGTPLVDFERSREEVAAALAAACALHGLEVEASALAPGYEEWLVHHDERDAPGVAGLAEAELLFDELARRAVALGRLAPARASARRPHPNEAMARFELALGARDLSGALAAARAALALAADAAAVAVPVVTAYLRAREHGSALAFLAEASPALEGALADLLAGKVLLAQGDAHAATERLRAACAAPEPYFQARRLLPHALRQAGRNAEAAAAMLALAPHALYPHGPLSVLAEWAWDDGDRTTALEHMRAAIEAAPAHRRGRMRTRLAEWLLAEGGRAEARAELALALDEDPTYPRARAELARIG